MEAIVSEDNAAPLSRRLGKLPAGWQSREAAGKHPFLFVGTPTFKGSFFEFIKRIGQTYWIISASGSTKASVENLEPFPGKQSLPQTEVALQCGRHFDRKRRGSPFFFFFFFYIRTPTTVRALQEKSSSPCSASNRQQGRFHSSCSSVFSCVVLFISVPQTDGVA